jgi:hypothetical protein
VTGRRAPAPLAAALLLTLLFTLLGLLALSSVSSSFAAAEPLPGPTQDPAVTHRQADEILSRREFQRAQPNLLQRIGRTVGDGFAALLRGLVNGGINAVVAWVILSIGAAVVVLVAVRLTRDVRADPGRRAMVLPPEGRRSPIEWAVLAEDYEARAEWKDALRCRYRALLAELVARHILRDRPAETTGEYRGEVSTRLPDAAVAFGGASELFERAWYGDRPTGPVENQRFRELADQVVEAT